MTARVALDPEPVAPVEPALTDCCRSGCSPCIFDLYGDALEQWQIAHAAWRQRRRADTVQGPIRDGGPDSEAVAGAAGAGGGASLAEDTAAGRAAGAPDRAPACPAAAGAGAGGATGDDP